VIENEKDLRLATAIVNALRPLRLTWLEAAVFHHYYWCALSMGTVAEITGRSLRELATARTTLVTKAAAALGYIEAPKELGPLTVEQPMSLEERTRRVTELLNQGLSWKEIGERLGVNPWTLWKYHQRKVVGRKQTQKQLRA